ncbi:histone acetyltransferase HPA2 [Vibrio ishigakensis]|uniref:Histone acetyltransferase HPA2 n=1 Tax=Vibrio ishigakensis TaxID=1481914 RepID=A0A0B8PC91_9VIBR|nr:histone acetyltransferase HPA2 [Vibrio ishigakensis]
MGVQQLPRFLQETYSDYHAVYLTVNCKNPAAFQCYLKAGFVDTEELYLGGDAGPQHVMKRACSLD